MWKFALVLLLCLCKPFKDLHLCYLLNNHRGGVLESGCKSTTNIPFHQIFLKVFCEKYAFYGLSLIYINRMVSKREIKKVYSIK